MEKHVIEGDRESGIVTVDDHGGGVTDEEDVYAGGVHVDGGGIVVGGDDGDGFAAAVLLAEVGESNAVGGQLGLRPTVHCALRHVAHQAPRQPPQHLFLSLSSLLQRQEQVFELLTKTGKLTAMWVNRIVVGRFRGEGRRFWLGTNSAEP